MEDRQHGGRRKDQQVALSCHIRCCTLQPDTSRRHMILQAYRSMAHCGPACAIPMLFLYHPPTRVPVQRKCRSYLPLERCLVTPSPVQPRVSIPIIPVLNNACPAISIPPPAARFSHSSSQGFCWRSIVFLVSYPVELEICPYTSYPPIL